MCELVQPKGFHNNIVLKKYNWTYIIPYYIYRIVRISHFNFFVMKPNN